MYGRTAEVVADATTGIGRRRVVVEGEEEEEEEEEEKEEEEEEVVFGDIIIFRLDISPVVMMVRGW